MAFFKEKTIIVIIAMYSLSIMLLVGQWAIGDIFGITMTDFQGHSLKPALFSSINSGQINSIQGNVTNTNILTQAVNVITTTGLYIFQVIQLASGTYIFNILYYLGVPAIMVIGMTMIYIILLMITVISYVYRV